MDKEYVYKDGKALLIDENDNQRVIDYYDNLDDVLSTEYLIGKMKENEKYLISDINELEKNKRFSKITNILRGSYLVVVLALFFSIIFPMSSSLTVLGEMEKVFLAFLISFFSVPGIMICLMTFIQEKEDLRNYNAKKMQLDNLRKELLKQEKRLEELKRNKINTNENGFYLKKIQNNEQDIYLDKLMNLFYNIGYDEDRFLKYYQSGDLNKKIDINDENLQEEIREYFKEKDNSLKRVRKIDRGKRK